MIPQGGVLSDIQYQEQSNRTYRLDLINGNIVGKIDGLDAVKQSAFKILQTERFQHLIYSFSYGVEFDGLIGKDPALIRSELKRRITEALLQDDRIEGIENFEVDIEGDSATAQFTVISQFGSFDVTEEVL